jgi:tRNA(Ile)-lysidine synthase
MTTQLARKPARNRLERHVAASAGSRHLLAEGDHLLVAVSGGPDSVALLSVLASLAPSKRLTLSALHLNYGLRGEESDEDERFVTRLCAELEVPLIRERVDLSGASGAGNAGSLQARARDVRYASLRRTAAAIGASKIALGHTADDQAETLLMWMLRGSGAAGLAGIKPLRDAVYVRPLLDVSRAEILSYLKAKGLPYRTDSSNAKPIYLRNRIRQELLPLLKRFNPAVVGALTRQADILRDEDACLDQCVSEWIGRHVTAADDRSLAMPLDALLDLPIALQRRVLRRVMQRVAGAPHAPTFGAADSVLQKVVKGRSGSSLGVRGAVVLRDYQFIRLFPATHAGRLREDRASGRTVSLPVDVPSTLAWPPTGEVIRLRFAGAGDGQGPAGRQVARFDADRFTPRLVVRSWQAGDAFCPLGMAGRRKKLQDYFSDSKLPRARRAEVPLLVAPEGILWVAGYRADHRFRVRPSTTRIVTAELLPAALGAEGKG